jgi:5'-nucleotidase
MRFRPCIAAALGATLVAAVSLAGGGTASAAKQPKLTILVTNDDGTASPGIAALAAGLRKLPGVKVVVVAPATEQTGKSDTTTPGELQASQTTTAGSPSTAVAGTPADSVNYALDTLKVRPDVVVSGVNKGQNVGPGVALSGTVGAAKTAARHGIPALAINQGYATGLEVPTYTPSVRAAVQWVKEHRKELTGKPPVEAFVDNLNVPTCAPGTKPRGELEVPIGTDTHYIEPQDCASTLAAPSEDVTALNAGFITLTQNIPF